MLWISLITRKPTGISHYTITKLLKVQHSLLTFFCYSYAAMKTTMTTTTTATATATATATTTPRTKSTTTAPTI
jgi:hypothetical protein